MAFDSEPDEASRKTLDDIRRELDAEYGYEMAEPVPVASDVAPDRRGGPARPDRRVAQEWRARDDADDDDTVDARLAHFREISDRHQASMQRHRPVSEGRPRRSGYLIAGLVGCVAGQALVLAFLIVTRYGGDLDVLKTSAVVSPGSEVAPAAAPIPPAPQDSQVSPETRPEPEASASQPSADLPPRVAQEPQASSSRQPAVVSPATVRDSAPPRVAPEPRAAAARLPGAAGTRDVAESQARLRAALTEWLRTSAGGGAPGQAATEPVIVLGPDGRTAKTYVSVASPVGLVPREQRWQLGARGWYLVDDRQAGLPRPMSSRER